MFAGFYYWIGKISGYQYPETLAQIQFWTTFIGVNLTFFPMHFLGLSGMPRRIPDYPDALVGWNTISTYGSYITTLSVILFFYIVYRTFSDGVKAGNDPWGVASGNNGEGNYTTLEWTLSSPPLSHTFEETPYIKSTPTRK
jgi:cytochrome c oxidase subunit 1